MVKIVKNCQHGLKWSKMIQNDQKRSKMVKIVKNGQNGQKWYKMVKNGGPDLNRTRRTGLSARRAFQLEVRAGRLEGP